MDLLASLQVEQLPEQQTRVAHLVETLADDPELQLGLNSCCTCGATSPAVDGKWVECRGCRGRVKYCSQSCRQQDADPAAVSNDNDEQAMGHSSVVCALLRLCNEDEAAEEGKEAPQTTKDRVRSELESYPATMANIIMEGPCYQELLANKKELTIHVIGASVEAELWGQEKDCEQVWSVYGEAFTQLVEACRLKRIDLRLIGPDCPAANLSADRTVQVFTNDNSSSKSRDGTYNLHVETYRSSYDKKLKREIPKADVVVFFNPGFTCSDYQWDETIASLQHGVGFLITTNTEMEGIRDCQYLLEKNLISALPPMVAAIMGNDNVDEADDSEGVFFAENPYAGSRVRQNGTMANDLYVRSRWMYGGVFAPRKETTSQEKRQSVVREEVRAKKPKKEHTNDKKSNPALI